MEQEIDNIRREIQHCTARWEYEKDNNDVKGLRFTLGYHAGLKQALALLDGDVLLVDDEVEAWWQARQNKKRVGKVCVSPQAISVWFGGKGPKESQHLFTLQGRSALYVNLLSMTVVFLFKRGIEIGLSEERE